MGNVHRHLLAQIRSQLASSSPKLCAVRPTRVSDRYFYQTNPFLDLDAFRGDTGDVQGRGWRDVALGVTAGGLKTLKLLQGLV